MKLWLLERAAAAVAGSRLRSLPASSPSCCTGERGERGAGCRRRRRRSRLALRIDAAGLSGDGSCKFRDSWPARLWPPIAAAAVAAAEEAAATGRTGKMPMRRRCFGCASSRRADSATWPAKS